MDLSPRWQRPRDAFPLIMIGCVVVAAITTAVDSVVWGWEGFIATGLGSFVVLALVAVLFLRRNRGTP